MSAPARLLKNIGVQVVLAMFIGVGAGMAMGEQASVFQPLGDFFIALIQMLVVPLIVVSIISGSARLGDSPAAGKIGIATFAFFMLTSAVAVALALYMGHVFEPGAITLPPEAHALFSHAYEQDKDIPGVADTILGMIPTNIFAALTSANILQIMVFCLFFGIAVSKQPHTGSLLSGLDTIAKALIWMVNIVMMIAPIGVFGLMASAVGTYGFEMLEAVFKLFWVYMLALLLYGFVFYPLLIRLFSHVSVLTFLQRMKTPQAVALSTASSMATLPVNMETCQEELGVSKATSSFVLPLGATINMSGNAIYYGLAAMFFAQLFGSDLTLTSYVAIIFTATVGAIGQAGVPGPSLLVVAVLASANIPVEGIPLLIGVDRLFDMTRTALNITGDAACAVIVDRFNPESAATTDTAPEKTS